MTHAIHTHKSKDMNITTQTKPQVDQLELEGHHYGYGESYQDYLHGL